MQEGYPLCLDRHEELATAIAWRVSSPGNEHIGISWLRRSMVVVVIVIVSMEQHLLVRS